MPKRNKLRNALNVINVSTMLSNQAARAKFVLSYKWDALRGDIIVYWFNGLELTRSELDILYPVELKIAHRKGKLPDARIKSIYL